MVQQRPDRPWVTADDRTGAFEIAAMLAGEGSPVQVSTYPDLTGDVVDLGSRPLAQAEASRRAAMVRTDGAESGDVAATWHAHKIDSLLRGNWPHEIRARARVVRRAPVVIAAWPAMGRTCVGGVVLVHGEPVGSVLGHLPEATHVRDVAALDAWWTVASGDPSQVAVVDVADDDALLAAARWCARTEVLPVGPAGAVGAVAAARFGAPSPAGLPTVVGRVAVVCGSASSIAHRQLERLRTECPDVEILAVPRPASGSDLEPRHAAELAPSARSLMAACAAVVIVGGDTAAAVLGDGPRLVSGFAGPGMPFGVGPDGAGPVVVTKAGAFGGDDALVEVTRRLRGLSDTVRP